MPVEALLTPRQVALLTQVAGCAGPLRVRRPLELRVRGSRLVLRAAATAAPGDPGYRQLLVSCGASMLNVRWTLACLGYRDDTVLLPTPGDPGHLATIMCRRGGPPRPADQWRLRAIVACRDHDDAFAPVPVPEGVIAELRAAAREDGVWTRRFGTDRLGEFSDLVTRAATRLIADPRYRAEVAAWTPDSGQCVAPPAVSSESAACVESAVSSESAACVESAVSSESAACVESAVLPESAASAVLPESTACTAPRPVPCRAGGDPFGEVSTIVVGTHQDDTMHWLRAGRAAQRLVLAAAGFDVAASLCEPATRVEPLRRRLPGMLGLPGPVQVVLRLGYPHRT